MKKLSLLGMFILIAMFSFNAKANIITLDGANEIANAFYTGQLKVVNISGQVVAETFCNQTTQIEVSKGVYIAITDNGSYKVVVFNK